MTLVTAEAGAGQVGDALLAKAGKVDPPAFVATEPTVGVSVGSQESPHSGPPMFRRIQGTVTGFACFVWLVLALRNLILLAGAANNLPALRKSSLPADHRDGELLSNLAAQAATNGVPDLRRLPEAKSPAAIGCLAPWIARPRLLAVRAVSHCTEARPASRTRPRRPPGRLDRTGVQIR